jgi:hypothetical protein
MLNSNGISSCRSIKQLLIHERKDIMRTQFGLLVVAVVLCVSGLAEAADAPTIKVTQQLIAATDTNLSGSWLLSMIPGGEEVNKENCIYIRQHDTKVNFAIWNGEYDIGVKGEISGNGLSLSGEGTNLGKTINFEAAATISKDVINGTYIYTGAYSEKGNWRAVRGKCKKTKASVRLCEIAGSGYALDSYVWDMIPDDVNIISVQASGPDIYFVSLHKGDKQGLVWSNGLFFGRPKAQEGNKYKFNVRYSDGTSEEAVASIRKTSVGFPTSLSPSQGEAISTLTPMFTWQPPKLQNQGRYRVWVVDKSDGNDVWSIYLPKEATSVVYNSDGKAKPLQPGKTYEWRLITFDKGTTWIPDNNVQLHNTFTVR